MWRLGNGPNDLEFEFQQGQIFFSSPKRGSGASRPGCFTPWRNKARFPLIMGLVVPQSRSGRLGEERNVLFLLGTAPPPNCSIHDARPVKYAQFLVAIFVLTFGLNFYTCSGMRLTVLRSLKFDSFQLHVTPIGRLEALVISVASFLIFCM